MLTGPTASGPVIDWRHQSRRQRWSGRFWGPKFWRPNVFGGFWRKRGAMSLMADDDLSRRRGAELVGAERADLVEPGFGGGGLAGARGAERAHLAKSCKKGAVHRNGGRAAGGGGPGEGMGGGRAAARFAGFGGSGRRFQKKQLRWVGMGFGEVLCLVMGFGEVLCLVMGFGEVLFASSGDQVPDDWVDDQSPPGGAGGWGGSPARFVEGLMAHPPGGA